MVFFKVIFHRIDYQRVSPLKERPGTGLPNKPEHFSLSRTQLLSASTEQSKPINPSSSPSPPDDEQLEKRESPLGGPPFGGGAERVRVPLVGII